LCLARAVHHVPQASRGQGAMPLGLASTEGLGLAWRASAWSCEDLAVSGAHHGALPLDACEAGTQRIRATLTLDCSQTRQCRTRPNGPTEDDGPPRSAVFRCSTAVPSHRFRNLRQRCSDHEPFVLVLSDLAGRCACSAGSSTAPSLSRVRRRLRGCSVHADRR